MNGLLILLVIAVVGAVGVFATYEWEVRHLRHQLDMCQTNSK